jgi:hypothetical protein
VTVKYAFEPGLLLFKVSPGGQVFVNGALKGTLPALGRLELVPGRYAIEVQYGTFPPLKRTVDLKGGQQLVVEYQFKEKSFFKKLFGNE